MDTNYGIFTNEDGSKELIELTNEEFDAIVEAREAMESVDESDEALNEFKKEIKTFYAAKRLADKQSGSHKLGKDINAKAVNSMHDPEPVKNKKELKARLDEVKNGKKAIKKVTKAQEDKRAENIKKAAKGKEVHSSRHAGREAIKKAVKESVVDWYNENSIEIDDYEMGRIDSFVENYVEENYSED